MRNPLLVSLLSLPLLLGGCMITRTPGFYSGYNRLAPSKQQQIHFLPARQLVPAASPAGLVYAVEAQSLLASLSATDTTLVYIWGPQCHSQVCASLRSVEAFCQQRGYQLYVVAEYYDVEQFSLQPRLAHPLLAINQQFYRTDYCPKYTRLFTTALRQGTALPAATQYDRYYLFRGRQFVRTRPTIPAT